MLGRTHIAAGVAVSLVVLQPHAVAACACAAAGGALGGWVCDVDGRGGRRGSARAAGDAVLLAVVCGLALACDAAAGGGACDWLVSHLGARTVVGAVGLAALLTVGFASPHRGFTHSLVACALFGAVVWLLVEPLAAAFVLGQLSHIALDLLNRKGLRLLWPLRRTFCLGLAPADGALNDVLFAVSLLASVALALPAALG